jgi:GT2 family glycosyltransferase
MLRGLVNKLLPTTSRRRKAAKRILANLNKTRINAANPSSLTYEQWVANIEPSLFSPTIAGTKLPLISIVVPMFNTPDKYLLPLVESVLLQEYTNWQLCLADASTNNARSAAIKRIAAKDSRITYTRLEENLGIAGNTNQGLKAAKGVYIGFADHDDTLSPFALNEVAILIREHPEADLIYSDEDKLSDNGKERSLPFFKPDWSPALLEGVNYMAHFVVVRRSFLEELGGLRLGYDGAQDYDFILRAIENTNNIYHIPKILYHWRMADGSTARGIGEKNYADDAGQKALSEHVQRCGIKATVVPIAERPTNYRLKYELPADARASIIIPFKDKVDYLKKLIPSIVSNSTDVSYEIILVSNNSIETETHKYLEGIALENKNIKVYEYNKPFNYSEVNNFGRSKATGNYLVFLNNDTEVISDSWLKELVGVAAQESNGAVGPLLLYPDNRIQHSGVVLGMNTMAGHVFRFRKIGELTPFGLPDWPRNYIAVTGACLVVSAKKFDEVGGFDESMIVAGSDVALCIRLHEKGYHNIYWPFAQLYHYESVSVGTYDNGIIGDYNRSLEYYTPYLQWKDPYYNQNLDLMNESVGLRSTYEQTSK